MIIRITLRTGAALAAAMVLGAVFHLLPAQAMSADRIQLAQASPAQSAPPSPAAPSAGTKPTEADRVEARIKSLHDQLKITADQEAQWSAVAEVMRGNAKAISDLVVERAKNAKTMTAIDDLRSYRVLAEAHVAGVKKLIPAFETLYAAMSDAQKKNADTVFSHRPRRAHSKKSG
jgi:periplasmic protein CpxP/Spy